MSGLAEPKHNATHVDAVGDDIREKDYHHQAEVLDDKELMTDAQNAETRDHEMTMWQAIKDHPMACFWAFVFCFTIVSFSAL
jgi:SP family general alpha glucoside:H+ symporter-like MFS transporter